MKSPTNKNACFGVPVTSGYLGIDSEKNKSGHLDIGSMLNMIGVLLERSVMV